MKALFDQLSADASRRITRMYSTSFSLGIHCLEKRFREPVCNIYGFVRVADEIVDTFLDYDRKALLAEFRQQTQDAISRRISTNPVLNSFQTTVHKYGIEWALIDKFLCSMEMDLERATHSDGSYKEYIVGSAEVVGLMCLRIFTEGNNQLYETLKPSAMRLGAAFQKVNFLRDMKEDFQQLGRVYFPEVNMTAFNAQVKAEIEEDIRKDFDAALTGIRMLPASARFGVYVAYVYYRNLFNRIRDTDPREIMHSRIRVPNYQKMRLLASSYFRHQFGMF